MKRKGLYIKDNGTHIALCIKSHIKKGNIVFRLQGPIYEVSTNQTICIGKHEHIKDVAGKYMNHSYYPNCRTDGRNIIAIRHIKPGDELTFSYDNAEWP